MNTQFRQRALTEQQVVAMAAGTAVAAVWSKGLSVSACVIGVGLAVLVGQPRLVVIGVIALASSRGAAANAAHVDLDNQRWRGEVRLVTDPDESRFGFVAEGRLREGADGGARVRLSFPWDQAGVVGDAVAGDVFVLDGQIRSIEQNGWTRSRHLRGRLTVEEARFVDGPPVWQRPSEWLRGVVKAGADGVPAPLRPLYLGLVIGDDRDQPLSQQAEFRSAGLSHLLAVSGQNVAFVLAVAAPLLRRSGQAKRLVLTIGLLVVFALATRLEPSVVRATVSAGIAATSVLLGRRSLGVRTLGLTVTALLLIDPFLARSIGFALSVLASAGIVIAGPAITARLPGPRWLAEAAGITLAAQLFVAPLLVWTFGPISVVSIPANVLAGWAAGAVMTWGLTGGVLAGLLPGAVATIVSLPASVLVWWIDAVAGWAVDLPVPRIGLRGIAVGGVVIVARATSRSVTVRGVAVVILVVLGWSAVPRPPPGGPLSEADWWPETSTTPSVLVVPASAPTDLVELVVDKRIDRIDIVVAERGNRTTARLIAELAAVTDIGVVLAPPQHRIVGADRTLEVITIETSAGLLTLAPDGDRLVVSWQPSDQ